MRRLWAYILSAFAMVLAVFTTFSVAVKNTKTNIEYEYGQELTFVISPDENNEDKTELVNYYESDGKVNKKADVLLVAEEMARRLDIADISLYEIKTVGNDTIKVSLSLENSPLNYSEVATYLSMNGKKALAYGKTDYVLFDDVVTGDAYLTTKNKYPCVIVPVDTQNETYTALIEKIREDIKNKAGNFETPEHNHEHEEGEEEPNPVYSLYLLYNFIEDEWDFEKRDEYSNYGYCVSLLPFQVTEDDTMYFPDEQNDKLFFTPGVGTGSADDKTNYSIISKYLVNMINAGQYDVSVKSLYNDTVESSAWIETITTSNNKLAFNSTLGATICAIVILAFLMVIYFKTGALAVVASTLGTTFCAFLSLLFVSAELNTFGIIGLLMVAIASIACGVVYCSKLKDESYKGRSLKKANQEAAKKSLLPIVDINVALIVIGVFVYIFGGTLVRSFAIITVFGGIVSVLFNLIVLRLLMWLATNATKLQGKYEAFGIDSKRVPNLMNEEKQSYFGSYENKDLTKNKLPVAIITGVLAIVSVVAMSVFGAKNNGILFKDKTTNYVSEIYLSTANENSNVYKNGDIENALKNIHFYDETIDQENDKCVYDYVDTIKSYNRAEAVKDEETVNHTIHVVKLTSPIDETQKAYYVNGTDSIGVDDGDTMTLNQVFDELFDEKEDYKTTVALKENISFKKSNPSFGMIALGLLVASAVLAIYYALRYRLARGIASFVINVVVGVISIGLFGIFQFLAIPSYVIAAAPFVLLFVNVINVLLANKEKEMILDDKKHDNSVENRKELMIKSTSLAFETILPMTIFTVYLGINFFGFGPAKTSWIYLVFVICSLIAVLVATVLYGPISQMLFKMFKGIRVKPRKQKRKVIVKQKSAEPEEAIFIGIND